jgi:hypothetical protein
MKVRRAAAENLEAVAAACTSRRPQKRRPRRRAAAGQRPPKGNRPPRRERSARSNFSSNLFGEVDTACPMAGERARDPNRRCGRMNRNHRHQNHRHRSRHRRRRRSHHRNVKIVRSLSLPLTLIRIALFSPEEGHGLFVFNILRTIHDGNDLVHGANRLTHPHTLGYVFEVALRRISIAPDPNPNFVVRHRTPPGSNGSVSRNKNSPARSCL